MRDIIKVFLLFNIIAITVFSSLLLYRALGDKSTYGILSKTLCIYSIASVTFWWYLNRFYIEENRRIEKTFPLSLILVSILCFYNLMLGKALFVGINFLLGNYMAFLFFFEGLVVLGLILYYIGTEIVPTPKMIRNPIAKIAVLLLAILSILGEAPQGILIAFIIVSMTYMSLSKLYGYKRVFALEILLLSAISLLSASFKRGFIETSFSLVVISNMFYLNLLQERGWILLKKDPINYVKITFLLLISSSLFLITSLMDLSMAVVSLYLIFSITESIEKEL